MSMFFIIRCCGQYDKSGKGWDDGITWYSRPRHNSKDEVLIFLQEEKLSAKPSLDKRVCPLVQELSRIEHKGKRELFLLIKAMGYQEAEERARKFCNTWFRSRRTPYNQRVSYKEMRDHQQRRKA